MNATGAARGRSHDRFETGSGERRTLADRVDAGLFWAYSAGVTLTHIVLQVAAAVALVRLLTAPRGDRRRFGAFGVVVGIYALSALVAFVRGSCVRPAELLPHAVLLGAIPMVAAARRGITPALRRWCEVFALLASLVAVAGAVHHVQGIDRTEGFFGGYFTLAGLLACALPITVALSLLAPPRWLWVWGALGALQMAALWWTYTRTAFLAVAIACSTWWAVAQLGRRGGVRPRRWALVIAAPLVLAALVLASPDSRINPWVNEIRPQEITEDLSSGRRGIIVEAAEVTAHALRRADVIAVLFGHGLESRQRLIGGRFTSWESDYLQAFMNQGLVGLACVVVFYGFLAGGMLAAWRHGDPLRGGIAAAGLAYWVMSFLTLKIASFGDAGLFALLYGNLVWGTRSTGGARGCGVAGME